MRLGHMNTERDTWRFTDWLRWSATLPPCAWRQQRYSTRTEFVRAAMKRRAARRARAESDVQDSLQALRSELHARLAAELQAAFDESLALRNAARDFVRAPAHVRRGDVVVLPQPWLRAETRSLAGWVHEPYRKYSVRIPARSGDTFWSISRYRHGTREVQLGLIAALRIVRRVTGRSCMLLPL